MVLVPALESQLQTARLGCLAPILAELGVECREDLEWLEEGDVHARQDINLIQKRRFLEWRAKVLDELDGRSTSDSESEQEPEPRDRLPEPQSGRERLTSLDITSGSAIMKPQNNSPASQVWIVGEPEPPSPQNRLTALDITSASASTTFTRTREPEPQNRQEDNVSPLPILSIGLGTLGLGSPGNRGMGSPGHAGYQAHSAGTPMSPSQQLPGGPGGPTPRSAQTPRTRALPYLQVLRELEHLDSALHEEREKNRKLSEELEAKRVAEDNHSRDMGALEEMLQHALNEIDTLKGTIAAWESTKAMRRDTADEIESLAETTDVGTVTDAGTAATEAMDEPEMEPRRTAVMMPNLPKFGSSPMPPQMCP